MFKNFKKLNRWLFLICFFIFIVNIFDTIFKIKDLNKLLAFDLFKIKQELKIYLDDNYKLNDYNILRLEFGKSSSIITIQSSKIGDVKFDIINSSFDTYDEDVVTKQNTINRQESEIRDMVSDMMLGFSIRNMTESEFQQRNFNYLDFVYDFNFETKEKLFYHQEFFDTLINDHEVLVECISPEKIMLDSKTDLNNYEIKLVIRHNKFNYKDREDHSYNFMIDYIKFIESNFKNKNMIITSYDFIFANYYNLSSDFTSITATSYHTGKRNIKLIKDLTPEQIMHHNLGEYVKNNIQAMDDIYIEHINIDACDMRFEINE